MNGKALKKGEAVMTTDSTGGIDQVFDKGELPAAKRKTRPWEGELSGRCVREKREESPKIPTPPSETGPSTSLSTKRTKKQKSPPLPRRLIPGSGMTDTPPSLPGAAARAAPSPGPQSLKDFEGLLEEALAMPKEAPLPHDMTQELIKEGDRQIERLLQKGAYLRAKDLAKKILELDPGATAIKLKLLNSLERVANRHEYISYAEQLVHETTIDSQLRVDIGQKAFLFAFKTNEFAKAIEFGNVVVALLGSDPAVAPQKAAFETAVEATRKAQERYASFTDSHKPKSPLEGISQEHFDLMTLMCSRAVALTSDQLIKIHDFMALCFGNHQLSVALRAAGQASRATSVLGLVQSPTAILSGAKAGGLSFKGGLILSSIQDLPASFQAIARELSIFAYKTEAKNIEKYMAVVDKLSTILERLEARQDVEAILRILHSLETASGSTTSVYSDQEIKAAQERFRQLMEGSIQTAIAPSERLSRADIVALHSLLTLKTTLEDYQQVGQLGDHPVVGALINQAKRAEQLAEKLMTQLGETYQTGDLSFRNFGKFGTLTGKSQGLMVDLYSLVTPFGHAAMIDRSLDLETISYSEVLGSYVHRQVPVEEFFTTDLYRLNIPSLITEEGRQLLEGRLNTLKSLGMISPLMTVEQYVQDTFVTHLETILAGPDISGPGIGDIEQTAEELIPPDVVLQMVQAKLASMGEAEKRQLIEGVYHAVGQNAYARLPKEDQETLLFDEALRKTENLTADELSKLSISEKKQRVQAAIARLSSEKAQQLSNEVTRTIFIRLGEQTAPTLPIKQWNALVIAAIKNLLGIKPAAVHEQERLAQAETYHQQAFGTIQNDGMLQLRAGINPFHRPLTMPWRPSPQPLDFKAVRFQGEMICSQFQALATLKALAMTQETLYAMMAEERARSGTAPQEMGETVRSASPSETLTMTEELPKTEQQQRAYEEALVELQGKHLFTFPVSTLEQPELLTPKRVVELFRSYLVPVPMAPVAKEILDLPDQFYSTALFGTTTPGGSH